MIFNDIFLSINIRFKYSKKPLFFYFNEIPEKFQSIPDKKKIT